MLPTQKIVLPGTSSWLIFSVSTGFMLTAIYYTWHLIGPFAYGGADGKILLSEIEVFRRYGSPFASHILNPLEGMAAFNSPLNLWLNPVLVPFLLLPADVAALVSTAMGFVCLSAASFALARGFGVGLPGAVLGAQFSVITFPPFHATTGFTSLFQLVPSVAASTALLMIAGCFLFQIKNRGIRAVLIGAAAIVIVAFCALLIDPAWFVGAVFILAPLGLFAVLDAPSADARIGRTLALAICGSVLGNRAARLSLLPVRVLVAALLPARMDTSTRSDLRILCLQLALSSCHLRRIRHGVGTCHRARPKG